MSKITNVSFVPGNTVPVATVNSKFTDVQTATQNLDETNFRSEAIDLYHMATDASKIKAAKRADSTSLSFTRVYETQNSVQVVQGDDGSGGAVALTMDMGSIIPYSAYDIIRLYWSVEVTAQVLGGGTGEGGNYLTHQPRGGLFWGIYPVWGTNNVSWTPVPGQAHLTSQTIAGQAANYLHTDSTLALMPIPHVLQYNEKTDSETDNNIAYRYPENNEKYSTSAAWFYRAPTSGSYRYFQLRLHGLLTGWNDGSGNSYLSDYYANTFVSGSGTKASITLRRIYLTAVHLRGS